MQFQFRVTTEGQDQQPRCALRVLSNGYGFCQGGFRSCEECPRAKLDQSSPLQIEPGDAVQTLTSGLCTFERFDERRGFRTGFVWLQTKRGLIRERLSAVTLMTKRPGCEAMAA